MNVRGIRAKNGIPLPFIPLTMLLFIFRMRAVGPLGPGPLE